MSTQPWPLLHVSELAEACEGCGHRATRTSSAGTRWCAPCWDAAAGGSPRAEPNTRTDAAYGREVPS